MKNDKIVDVYNSIKLSDEAKNRIRAKVLQTEVMQTEKKDNKRRIYKRAVAIATAAAVMFFAIFGTALFDQIFDRNSNNLFAITVYAMELQPDGTYEWREVDIAQLYGWGEHYDGEVLYIGLGLWFEFEGENIRTVEFSLEDGFFATQYIGNFGEVPNITRWHISVPPDFTTSRLVMYGNEFEKIGNIISFGNYMPDDILLFWGSYDMSANDWWQSNKVIEIDVKVIFEDGEIHNQQLVLDFIDGWGMGWFDAELLQ